MPQFLNGQNKMLKYKWGKQIMNVVLDENAFMPTKAHEDDAGFDLYTPDDIVVKANRYAFLDNAFLGSKGVESVIIDTGVHISIPKGYVGMIKSKSGLNVKHGLISEGVIDSGYTGSIVVKMYNLSQYEKHFKRGDKIAQLVIMPISTECLELVDKLDDTERGDGGFGSTGR